METMEGLRERVAQRVPIGDLLESLLHETGYIDALKAERSIEAEGREENLAELVEFAREFDASAEADEDTLDVFLQGVALVADADTRTDDDGLVTLMTIHNAKGLEYPIVFIAGMEEGVFPHSRALDEGGLEEERRLAYVGITRAMRSLYMTQRAAAQRLRRDAVRHALALPRRGPARSHRPRRRAAHSTWCRRAAARFVGLVVRADTRPRAATSPHRPSGSATTCRTRRSAPASSPASRPAGSSSCASPATAASASSWRSTRRSPGSDRRETEMSAQIIDGKAIAADVRAGVAKDVAAFAREFDGAVPGLATILVGDDPASAVYVNGKQKACAEVGMQGFSFPLPADTPRAEVVALVERLNADPAVSGILCQLPLPEHLDGVELTGMIDPQKDVDGLTRAQRGAARPRPRRAAPVHPVGRHAPAGRGGRGARGRGGGRRRALEPVRQADGAAAAGRRRDRHDVPLAHARP